MKQNNNWYSECLTGLIAALFISNIESPAFYIAIAIFIFLTVVIKKKIKLN